jgi:hypothetical protein
MKTVFYIFQSALGGLIIVFFLEIAFEFGRAALWGFLQLVLIGAAVLGALNLLHKVVFAGQVVESKSESKAEIRYYRRLTWIPGAIYVAHYITIRHILEPV